ECGPAMSELREKIELMRSLETDLVTLGLSPHAPYSVSDELFSATAEMASQYHLPIAVHIAESDAETRFVCDGDGDWAESHRRRGIQVRPRARSPMAILERTGILASQPLLLHCIRVDSADRESTARHSCPVAHCPAPN